MGGAEYGVLVQLQESITTWPALVPCGDLAGKPSIPLGLAVVLIGSRQSANVRINSTRVSRAHALVISSDKRVVIRDLASRTGTTVNGRRIREAQLQPGDQVGIGPFTFEFAPGLAMPPLAERQPLAPGQLEVLGGMVQHTGQRITLIGKRSDSDVVIHDEEVSTAHAALFDMDGRRYIRDLGSRLGTYVNGQSVNGIEIRLGDEIRIGSAVLRYLAAPPRVPGMVINSPRISKLEARVETGPLDEPVPATPLPEINGNGNGHSENGHPGNGHSGNGHHGNGAHDGAEVLQPEDEFEAHDEQADHQALGEVSIVQDKNADDASVAAQPAIDLAVTPAETPAVTPAETPLQATAAISADVLEALAQAAEPIVEPVAESVVERVVEKAAEPAAEVIESADVVEPAGEVIEETPVQEAPVEAAPVEAAPVLETVIAEAPAVVTPVAPVRTLEFDALEDWAAISPMLQANLMVLPVPVSHGATLIQMPEPAVQWPAVIVGGMTSSVLPGWDTEPAVENQVVSDSQEKVAEAPVAAKVEEPVIGEIEVIWTSAPSMSASMTVDLVWDEPQVTAPPMARRHDASAHIIPAAAPALARADERSDATSLEPALEPVDSVVDETPLVQEKPSAPEPQTVGWTGQGNPEGWGPLAAAVTVAPVIGTATPNSTLTGAQSIPRRPLLQTDGSARPAPRSNYPYAFDAPLDLTPLWAVLGVLGIAGFAALLWFVVIPAMLPKGHPTPSGAVPTLPANPGGGAVAGKPSDRKEGREAAAPTPVRPRPVTGTPARPASRPAEWLE